MTGTTIPIYGVIGDPVAHSLSPLIHRGWYEDHGIAARYDAFHVKQSELGSFITSAHPSGIRGLNVTLPHKSDVLAHVAKPSALVQTLGAANTLTLSEDAIVADNTDAGGFYDDLTDWFTETGRTPRNILFLGAGGSARAALHSLCSTMDVPITLLNRTVSKADALKKDLGLKTVQVGDLSDLSEKLEAADLVINATSAGHGDTSFSWPSSNTGMVYDLSYGAASERLLAPARAAGWHTRDGLGMLVAQAARSFQHWFGITPDRKRALERCRKALIP